MNYGMMVSASGMMSGLYRMDVWSNNLANVNTSAFKPDMPFARTRDAARQEDGLGFLPSNDMLERLGAGVTMGPNRLALAQGGLEPSTNALDLALDGIGFLMTRTGESSDPAQLRLTRDGRLALDERGRLVLSSSGLPLLDTDLRPITLDSDKPVSIDARGDVTQGGARIGRLAVVDVPDRDALRRSGEGLFSASPAIMARRTTAPAAVRQFHTERSGVDPVRALMQINSAQSAVSSAGRMIQMHDQLMDRAINTLGRVA
ncbi:MAG: flagellar hook-basal body complex protein [Phycisphaerae bacterium]|nr:flagellar hook-basal body complex protein [Phycisphaerae bacterium]